jgi:nucleoid-associated protein YgaU
MRTTGRNVSFVLLLATGVVLAGNEPEAGEAQARAEAEQARAEEAQGQTAGAQDKTEGAQGQAEEEQTRTDEEGKLISVPGGTALGMSILGNQEAPTSLVIVPWKTSELGNSLGIEPMLDDSRHPVDKDVFMRALRYYEIRSETSQGPRP